MGIFKRAFWVLVLTEVLGASLLFASSGYDLKALYERALEKDVSLEIQKSVYIQSQEKSENARSAFHPQIKASLTKGWSEVGSQNKLFPELSAEQILFAGGRKYKLLKESLNLEESRKLELSAAKRDLFITISDLYFDILSLQREHTHVRELLKIFDKRISELKSRVKIGKSRRAELVAVQTQQRIANSEEFTLKTSLSQKRELLAQITEVPANVPLQEKFKTKFSLPQGFDLANREDLQALEAKSAAAKERIESERSTYWPQLLATGTYYPNGSSQNDENNWQLALKAEWKLWDGLETSSRVGEKIQERAQSELKTQLLRKQINSEYQNLSAIVKSAEEQLFLLEEGVKFADLNSRLQVEDYSRGVISTLDLLQSLDSLIDAQRRHDRKLAEVNKSYNELMSLSGELPL